MRRLTPFVLTVLAFALWAYPCPAAIEYTLTPLGTLRGGSEALGINNHGQVVGYSDVVDNPDQLGGPYHAFRYDNGVMVDLFALGGQSAAQAINDSGYAVGYAAYADADQVASVFHNGTATPIDGLVGGSFAHGINNAGQITGYRSTATGVVAFLYSGGVLDDLGALPGGSTSYAFAINEHGHVVGHADAAGPTDHAFLFDGSTMHDLGTLPGMSASSALAINDNGQVVGSSANSGGPQRAFLYDNGAMVDLGTLGGTNSLAYGISNAGEIVGWADTANGSQVAAVWRDGRAYDLLGLADSSAEGWGLVRATAINDDGLIVGYGVDPDGNSRAFLLTPIAEVPVPGALVIWAALGACGAGVAWRRLLRAA